MSNIEDERDGMPRHVREGMAKAKTYMRGMNSLAGGGSFGPPKTAGQYGAESAADEYTKARKATGRE